MDGEVQQFSVPFQFPVCFTRDVWRADNPLLLNVLRRAEPTRRHKMLVVVDSHVANAHPSLIRDVEDYCAASPESLTLIAPPLVVPGGEQIKNDVTHLFVLLQRMNDVGLDRQSFVIVIGGGAVLDTVSFAAAIAHRGIRVVRLPTTVLSQADSGVAVKNGINLFGKKNFAGTFVPPFAVINDLRFLETLDHRDRIGGVAEAIKVSLLRDPAFFEYIEANAAAITGGDSDVLARVIERSAQLHLAHICGNGDPFELGSARPLDFGHWAAHKLESITGHRLRHGEAVAIGMALDILYSVRMGALDRPCADRMLRLLAAIGFQLWDDAILERDAAGQLLLIQGLREFREHLGGELHVTLLRGFGRSFEVTEMDEALVRDSITELAACGTADRAARRLVDAPDVQ